MPKKKPLVFVTRRLPEIIETRMCELFDTRLNETDRPLKQEELAEAMRTADVLGVFQDMLHPAFQGT